MRVVIAPDKFKGSATAAEVARRLAAGLRRGAPDVETVVVPMADGGEGTVDAALAAGFLPRTALVTGPTGAPVGAAFAVHGRDAVVEMAQASGLDALPGGRPDPLGATTAGTGELILAALDAGCRRIVLGVGGSATTDGGAGMLVALGARLLRADGTPVTPGGGGLRDLETADLAALDPRLADTELVLASDVDNPLLGAAGAAAVFAPQKGASPADVEMLEAGLARLVDVLGRCALPVPAAVGAVEPGAGAAGGIGFAALAVLGAGRRPGVELVMELVGLETRLRGADLVVTGEGRLDEQSLGGKTPIGVARVAGRAGIPVVAVCGITTLAPERIAEAGFAEVHPLTAIEPDPARSIAMAGELLETVGERIAAVLPALAARYDVVFRAWRVLVDGELRPAQVGVRAGVIVRIAPLEERLEGEDVVELAVDEVLLPGLVDVHHRPAASGRGDLARATRAAADAGVTTLIELPPPEAPEGQVAALAARRRAARGSASVDVGFWAADDRGGAAAGALIEAGALGVVVRLRADDGPEAAGRRRAAMVRLREAGGTLVVAPAPGAAGPGRAEADALAELLAVAEDVGVRVHVAHPAIAAALPEIRAARRSGLALTAETTVGALVGGPDADTLWAALADGTIDAIAPDEDSGAGPSWLSVVHAAAGARGIGLERVAAWTAEGPARAAGLRSKGSIAVGRAADLTVFAPGDAAPGASDGRGWAAGAVRATYLGGRPVDAGRPHGRLLRVARRVRDAVSQGGSGR